MTPAHLVRAPGSGVSHCACGHHYASHGEGEHLMGRWHEHVRWNADLGRYLAGPCKCRTAADYHGCIAAGCHCMGFHADYERRDP